ncbi:hypothetical protein HDU76_005672 [Blyttiomyces sp. JEL0837]|nr:hypothetical protein HDU76_005672 [Blyttiomyces sp. JEL0837]
MRGSPFFRYRINTVTWSKWYQGAVTVFSHSLKSENEKIWAVVDIGSDSVSFVIISETTVCAIGNATLIIKTLGNLDSENKSQIAECQLEFEKEEHVTRFMDDFMKFKQGLVVPSALMIDS